MPEARCNCGRITLEISGEPLFQVYCHCRDCQQVHGGAYARNCVYPAQCVEVATGKPVGFALKSAERQHCPDCATHLFTEVAGTDLRSINACILPVDRFEGQFHVHCEDAWLPVRDTLPHYRRLPALFGGSDECVDW